MANDFYPRPPRGGRRPAGVNSWTHGKLFLSTPSARRATQHPNGRGTGEAISIHALREEGDACPRRTRHAQKISIHALREEGDLSAPP